MNLHKLIYPVRFPSISGDLDIREDNSIAVDLHRYYFKLRGGYLKSRLLWGFYNWIFNEILKKSSKLISRNHERIHDLTGMSRRSQYWDLIFTCLTMPCKPKDYYIYEFYYKKNKENGRNYIFKYQTKNMLYRMLLEKEVAKDLGKKSPLTNKEKFQKRTLEAGLPIIPTICIIEDGEIRYYTSQEPQKIQSHLFAKALTGKGGKDAEVWKYKKEQDRYQRKKGDKYYTFEEIVELYKKHSDTRPMIIQKKIKNHEGLRDLSCNTLSTYRVVTMINERQEAEVVGASIRMAAKKGKVVDNFHKGGIAAPIEIDTGILGEATDLGIYAKVGYLTHHPITKAEIVGRKVPMWEEAKAVAQNAHQYFKPRIIIGWDIAITEDGPVIVEGNAQPCSDIIQRTTKKPLATTRFGELMRYHIERNNG